MRENFFNLRIGSRQVSFELILIVSVILIHLFVAFAPENSLMAWYPTDDAFYYFKVAQHIVSGEGVTFDGFNSANGFHPLWMVICIIVFSMAEIDLILPLRIMVIVLGVFNAFSAVLLYKLLIRFLHAIAAGLMALAWAFLPTIHRITTQLGMESGINAFAVIVFLTVIERSECKEISTLRWKDYTGLGIAAALVLFSRLDNIFLVAAAGLWLVFRVGGLRGYLLVFLVGNVVATILAFFLRLGFTRFYLETMGVMFLYMALGTFVRLPLYYWLGMQRSPKSESLFQGVLRSFIAVTLGTLGSGLLMFVLTIIGLGRGFPRSVILIDWGISILLVLCIRVGARALDFDAGESRAYGLDGLRRCLPAWLRASVAYGLPLGLLLAGYIAWNLVNFGTFMPVSGQIKQWWGALNDTVYGRSITSFQALFGLGDLNGGPWALLWQPIAWLGTNTPAGKVGLSIVLLIYVGFTAWRWSDIRPVLERSGFWLLLGACLLQVLYYNGTYYVNLRPWYWVNHLLLIVIFWAVLLHGLINAVEQAGRLRTVMQPLGWILGGVLVINYGIYQFDLVPLSPTARSTSPDQREARALERLTEPGSRIGMTGGGVVAYFIQDRTIVNLDGLMNSNDYFKAMKAGRGQDIADRFRLSYVFGDETILNESDPYYYTLANRLVKKAPVGGGFLFEYHPEGVP